MTAVWILMLTNTDLVIVAGDMLPLDLAIPETKPPFSNPGNFQIPYGCVLVHPTVNSSQIVISPLHGGKTL